MFIMNENEIEEQIIYLLETITEPIVNDVEFDYNEKIIEKIEVATFFKKDRLSDIWVLFKDGVKTEEVEKEVIGIRYAEKEDKKISEKIPLKQTSRIDRLIKYFMGENLKELLKSSYPEDRKEAIEISLKYQILCKHTAYICKIKENPQLEGK